MTSSNPPLPSGYRRTRDLNPAGRVSRLQPAAPPVAFSLGDIYYVLFRQKWRIIICFVLGVVAAAAVYMSNPPSYRSEGKLFIRYVLVDGRAAPRGEERQMKDPDRGGETIMDSEREILTSLDLARKTAEIIGPDRILGKASGPDGLAIAARVISDGLLVEIPPRSTVIHVAFRNPDPTLVQPVLSEVINQYYQMHQSIHQAVGMVGDFVTQETEQLRTRLTQTEEDLRKARNRAGVISPEDAKKGYAEQIGRIQQALYSAQADLAERKSVYDEVARIAEKPKEPVPADKMSEFRGLNTRLDLLRKREQDLLSQFTAENSRVVNIRELIGDAEKARNALMQHYPQLGTIDQPVARPDPAFDVNVLSAQVIALQSRVGELTKQLNEVKAEANRVDEALGSIEELRRRKELQESNYRYYAASLEQSRINEALGAGKVSNISPIQAPSSPMIERQRTIKLLLSAVIGGLAAGLVWAFFIELYLDRSVRRPADIERSLGLPLFLSIPVLKNNAIKKLTTGEVKGSDGASELALGAAVPNSSALELQSFHATLRDRLIGYFESQGLTHKPKLVAVTGLDRRAGVTTTAAGLASSLSETGEGNVLLVDMTMGQGSAQQFYRGEKICNLDEILAQPEGTGLGDAGQVQDRLYVVAEEPGRDKIARILPMRFSKLVPKLKASRFDYIIFDMPPVNQISITPRLAGFMDMVLLVVESEKTDRDLLQRATSMLAETNAHVGAVFNKVRNYVPTAFYQEYLGNN